MHRRQLAALGLLAAMLPAIAGCGRKSPSSFPGAPLFLISIDTLRSDHLPSYGYSAVQTPALDAFRREAILYARAYSHYPLTFPSHSSMLSGLLPGEHGARDNIGYPLKTEGIPFLPRDLRAAGYATGGAVSAYVLTSSTGIADGFDFYDDAIEARRDTPLGGLQRKGEDTVRAALAWLDRRQGKPPFLFLHLYEPHSPYVPPEPFRSRYSNPYDGEIAHVDAIVGQFFSELRKRDLYNDALIVVLSDHGEGLGDHGEDEHGILLYREAIQVPLLVKLPGGSRGGETVDVPAQLIDVAPTFLGAAGLPVPQRLRGKSLLSLGAEDAGRGIYSETLYPRLHMGWSDLASLVQSENHYIEGPNPELFDVVNDAAERTNVIERERRAFATMRALLQPLKVPLGKPSEVDPETQARLAALGYTGAVVADVEGPLPDPRTQVGSLRDLKEGARLMSRKEWAAAIPVFERLVREQPRMQDARERLGLCLHRAGRRGEAVEVYKRALESSGGSAQVALTLSALYFELGAFGEAKAHAELALKGAPSAANERLAEIALAMGDSPGAETFARKSSELEADRPAPYVLLAQILARRGSLEEAQAALAKADSLVNSGSALAPPSYHFVRGDLFARQGRVEDAKRELEEEIRRNPDVLDAYSRLAVLLTAAGQVDAAVDALRRMVESNQGSPAAYAAAVEALRVLGDTVSASRLLAHARGLYPQDAKLRALASG